MATRIAAGRTGTTREIERGRWLVLFAMVFGPLMSLLDHLVVNVALRTIHRGITVALVAIVVAGCVSFVFVRSHVIPVEGGEEDDASARAA